VSSGIIKHNPEIASEVDGKGSDYATRELVFWFRSCAFLPRDLISYASFVPRHFIGLEGVGFHRTASDIGYAAIAVDPEMDRNPLWPLPDNHQPSSKGLPFCL
jgi:hypothetical protein